MAGGQEVQGAGSLGEKVGVETSSVYFIPL